MPGTRFQKIIWLASYPKSGNTWLRLFLDAYLLGHYDLNNIVCSVSDDIASRHAIGDGIPDVKPETKVTKLPVDIQQMTRPMALLRLVLAFNENTPLEGLPLFVKTHNSNHVANGFALLPTQVTKATIHIVRDPRDVCISFAKHMGCTIDQSIDFMADRLRCLSAPSRQYKLHDFISSWREHTNSFISSDAVNCMTFRYEDMVRDPVTTFAKILFHCEIEPDMERVKKAVEDVELGKLREKEKKEGFTEASPKNKEGFFGKGGSHWKEVLEPRQILKIEKMAGPMMKRFGYQLAKHGGATKFAA